jgi:hypothetical protein
MKLNSILFVGILAPIILTSGCISGEFIQGMSTLKECIIYDEICDRWHGIGKVCESDKQCHEYLIKDLKDNAYSDVQTKCEPTQYEKLSINGLYISCNPDEDCYEQSGIFQDKSWQTEEDKGFNEVLENSMKESHVLICRENFCETTKWFHKVWSQTILCSKNDDGTFRCQCCDETGCKTVTRN